MREATRSGDVCLIHLLHDQRCVGMCASEGDGGVQEGRIKACNPTSFLIHMTTVAKPLMKNSGVGSNNEIDACNKDTKYNLKKLIYSLCHQAPGFRKVISFTKAYPVLLSVILFTFVSNSKHIIKETTARTVDSAPIYVRTVNLDETMDK
jgi:hypothetical protein